MNKNDDLIKENNDSLPSETEEKNVSSERAEEELSFDVPLTDEEKKRKKIRKILGYIGFFLINALVIAVLLIVEDKSGDTASGKEAFNRLLSNWYYAILAFAMFFIIVTFDTIVFSLLIKKTGTKVKRSGLAIKVAYLGRYYDRITPWAIGGEPFQMAYLTRGGLKTGQSCAVTMSRHIIRFFTTAVLVIAILIASRIATSIWVMVVAIFSVLIGLIIPSFMLICAFRPRLGERIARFCLDVLYKLHIVKNYEKNWSKLQETVDHFLQGIKYLSSNKQVIILIAIGAIIELFATNSVPFFVIRAFGNFEFTYWRTFVLCIFVSYASSFAPTPGGAGIAELSFYAIFAATIEDGYLFWAVLTWRLAIFYVPVFVGFIIHLFDTVGAIIKTAKNK